MTVWLAPFSRKLSDSAERIYAEVNIAFLLQFRSNHYQISKPTVGGPSKISIDISIKSPVIYVPCSSTSTDGLTIYLGNLPFTFFFQLECLRFPASA